MKFVSWCAWRHSPRPRSTCRWNAVGELKFDKALDVLDSNAVDRLAALTVPKAWFGYYVPPFGGGEEALVNILPMTLPTEIFVSSTPHSAKKAAAILLGGDEPPRFDWVIKGETFWSFSDPRETVCRQLVDLDQVEAVDTSVLAFHEDHDEENTFAFLLRKAFDHQVQKDLIPFPDQSDLAMYRNEVMDFTI
jgi:hypothetical protein